MLASGNVTDPLRGQPGTRSTKHLLPAGLLGVLLAATLLLGASRGDIDRMAESDGLIYRYVAAHLSADPEQIHPVVVERGTSLRYGRIGLPVVIWVAAAGQPRAMRYAHPIIIVLIAGIASAASARLLPRLGLGAAVVPFLAPGFSRSIVGGFAEVLAVALCLWGTALVIERRFAWSALAFSAALLTRENAGFVLLGAILWLLVRKKSVRAAALLLVSVIPVLGWYAYVASRYGHIPILDPYLRVATDTIDAPFIAIWRSLTESPAASTLLVAIHLVVAAFALTRFRSGLIGAIAATCALQIVSAGVFSWHFTGEATRSFVFLQLFALLALVPLVQSRASGGPRRVAAA